MKLSFLSCIACLVLATGCARPPTKVGDSVAIRDAQIVTAETVSARETLVIGEIREAAEMGPEWAATIDLVTFRQAFQQSLLDNRLLSVEPRTDRYRVNVEIKPLDTPGAGFDMRVGTTIRYDVINIATNETVMDEDIVAHYSARFDESFMGAVREHLAIIGSVRENIKLFMIKFVALPHHTQEGKTAKESGS